MLSRDNNQLLKQLSRINTRILPDELADYVKQRNARILNENNPSWEFLTYQDFIQEDACVRAFSDERLPEMAMVGFFAAQDQDSGIAILNEATNFLAKQASIKHIYGPIDASIIHNYRLNRDEDLAFPGEPVNPSFYHQTFQQAGFQKYNTYFSAKATTPAFLTELQSRRLKKKYPRTTVKNITRSEMVNYGMSIAELSQQIFPQMSNYCPNFTINEALYSSGFDDLSGPNDIIVKILYDHEEIIGAVFGFMYKQQLIIKTIGVLPKYQGSGISKLLIHAIHKEAKQRKAKQVVYALARRGNRVDKLRRPNVKLFREYYSYVKDLK